MSILNREQRIHFERTVSTHKYALEEARRLADGTVITADFQTGGCGRNERKWLSPPRSALLASVVLKSSVANAQSNMLIHVMALAAAELINRLGLKPSIKWPNDVLTGGKKIAGVLAESSMRGGRTEYAVLSAGINLNLTDKDVAEIDRPATSVMIETGKEVEIAGATDQFLEILEDFLELFIDGGRTPISRLWNSFERMSGKTVKVNTGGEIVQGEVVGFNEDCSMLLKDDDGTIRTLQSGEIERILR